MSRKTVSELQAYFETGDVPTAANFVDLIDSTYNSTSGVNGTTGFSNLSVESLSAGEFYIFGILGTTESVTLSTAAGNVSMSIVNGIITAITPIV
jgi:hypothetical protein